LGGSKESENNIKPQYLIAAIIVVLISASMLAIIANFD
jgi:hypothetical protein